MPPRKIDGKWHTDVWVQPPGKPRVRLRKKSPINTKAAAAEYEKQLLADALSTSTRSTPVPTLEAFAAEFLSVYVANNNKLSEAQTKEAILRVHLLPALGALPLDAIDVRTVETYKARKKAGDAAAGEKPLSLKTVNNHLTVLGKVLVVARDWGLIERAPKMLHFKLAAPAFDFLTFAESAALVAAAPVGLWRAMVLVAVRTGLRLGELLALRWVDVLWEQRRLMVTQSMTRQRIGTPKSGKKREVPLSPDALAALRAWQAASPGPYVFSETSGEWTTKGTAAYALERIVRESGLRHLGWHVLRHTFASQLAMRGASLKAIQEMMGHSTIEMTLRYAHLSPHIAQEAVAMLDVKAAG